MRVTVFREGSVSRLVRGVRRGGEAMRQIVHVLEKLQTNSVAAIGKNCCCQSEDALLVIFKGTKSKEKEVNPIFFL